MSYTTIKSEIATFFRGDIEDATATLDAYSHDASLFTVRPELVLFPKDAADICALVKWSKENKTKYPDLSITPRAAGTCMSGGPLNTSLILDVTRYMNQVMSVEAVNPYSITPLFPGAKAVTISGTATVLPGCYYRDFETATLAKGLVLPCYTASKSINAVGGMVGNNSAGELTLRYGKTEDYVSSLKVVFADGYEYIVRPLTRRELYVKMNEVTFEGSVYKTLFSVLKDNHLLIHAAKPNVSKNSAGYNLWNVYRPKTEGSEDLEDIFDFSQLIIGSQGTLGIVTEIAFRLVKPEPVSKLFVVFLKDLTPLGEIVSKLALHSPQSLESYDDKTFGLAIRFFPEMLKQKGIWDMFKFSVSVLPEFWMTVTGGVPKLVLLVEFSGSSEAEVHAKCLAAQEDLQPFHLASRITRSAQEAEKYWTMRRDSFALLRSHAEGRRTAPFIDDIVVNPEHLPTFLPKLNAILSEYPDLVYTIAGHAGNGNFHIIPLMKINDPFGADTILALSEKVYDLVVSFHGSITAEHNDGIIRTPYLSKMFSPEILEFFALVKTSYDPQNIFNPGKKVGGTIDALKKALEVK